MQKNTIGIAFHSPCFPFPCSIHITTHTLHTTSHLPPSDQREFVTPVSASGSQETSAHLESTAILESTVHLPIETYKMEGSILRILLAFSHWSPIISHVYFHELHAHQPRSITNLIDGPVG